MTSVMPSAAIPSDRSIEEPVFQPAQPLAVEVLPLLENEIITRRLAPGDRLIEIDLCARYGISRSPMREALRILVSKGLIVHRPRFGARVAPMSLENLDHIYACRVPLEALAARTIAERQDRGPTVKALYDLLDRMRGFHAAGNIDGTFTANVDMTDILHTQTGNPVLSGLLDQLNKPALRYRHWGYAEQPEVVPLSIEANAAIVMAIADGDAAGAATLTRTLIESVWHVIRRALEARPV